MHTAESMSEAKKNEAMQPQSQDKNEYLWYLVDLYVHSQVLRKF